LNGLHENFRRNRRLGADRFEGKHCLFISFNPLVFYSILLHPPHRYLILRLSIDIFLFRCPSFRMCIDIRSPTFPSTGYYSIPPMLFYPLLFDSPAFFRIVLIPFPIFPLTCYQLILHVSFGSLLFDPPSFLRLVIVSFVIFSRMHYYSIPWWYAKLRENIDR